MLPVMMWSGSAVALLTAAVTAKVPVGVWEGETSQKREIRLSIEDGGIASVRINYELVPETPCTPVGTRMPETSVVRSFTTEYPKPQPLSGNSMSLTINTPDAKILLDGKLQSDGSMSGDLVVNADEASMAGVPPPIGTDCKGKATVSWKAKRKDAKKD